MFDNLNVPTLSYLITPSRLFLLSHSVVEAREERGEDPKQNIEKQNIDSELEPAESCASTTSNCQHLIAEFAACLKLMTHSPQ